MLTLLLLIIFFLSPAIGGTSTGNIAYLSSLGLHVQEYPNDDFSHILGASSSAGTGADVGSSGTHTPSKLQQICKLRLEEVARSKGRGGSSDQEDCSVGITSDQYLQLISEFDAQHGPPLNLQERIAVDAMVLHI